jgi:hypothetical protein
MMEGPGFDPFEVLGVGMDADAVVIQLAYRVRIRAVHPDIAGPAGLEHAKRLNLAREWLLDPERRARLRWAGPTPAPGATPKPRAGHRSQGPRVWARPRRAANRAARATDQAASLELGPQTERLRAFLGVVRTLTPDERARVNYSLGDARPMSFDAYEAYLDPRLSDWSRALRDSVAGVWERGVDEPAPFLHPLGRIVPSGFLVANAFAQWILLGDVFRHELGDAVFRSEHVYDAFEARCRGPWEGSIGQARYGPNGARVMAFLRTAHGLPADAGTRLARAWYRHLGRDGRDEPSERVGPGIWLPAPPGYPAALTVSGYLAAVDAARIAPPAGLARRDQDGFRYGLRLTAHVLAMGLAGRAAHAYLQPWREAVGVAV